MSEFVVSVIQHVDFDVIFFHSWFERTNLEKELCITAINKKRNEDANNEEAAKQLEATMKKIIESLKLKIRNEKSFQWEANKIQSMAKILTKHAEEIDDNEGLPLYLSRAIKNIEEGGLVAEETHPKSIAAPGNPEFRECLYRSSLLAEKALCTFLYGKLHEVPRLLSKMATYVVMASMEDKFGFFAKEEELKSCLSVVPKLLEFIEDVRFQ